MLFVFLIFPKTTVRENANKISFGRYQLGAFDKTNLNIMKAKLTMKQAILVNRLLHRPWTWGSFPKSSHTKRFLKMVLRDFLLGAQHKKRIVWRTNRQACLLCPLGKALNGTPPPLYGRQMAYSYFTGLQL